MFIKTSQSGYDRNGEQFARGSFLILFSHNPHKWAEQHNRPHFEDHGKTFDVVSGEGFVIQKTCQCAGTAPYTYTKAEDVPTYYLRYCPVHQEEYREMPADMSRKLYACVRHVSLRQFGAWIMGRARIAGQSVTLSGSYGADGLTCDYEDLTPAARAKLTEVPTEVAEQFWKGEGGHNCAGSEGPVMREWAKRTFRK